MKIGMMCSGNLGAMVLEHITEHYRIVCVMTDSASLQIKDYCCKKSIPLFCGNPRNGKAKGFIVTNPIDILLSVNYLFIVEKDIIEWPEKIAINVHGSLLPKYRGRTPHVWAIINNEVETGITAHVITEECDAGDIVAQIKIPIHHDSTGADILHEFGKHYVPLLLQVLSALEKGTLQRVQQKEEHATYFGKRTPDDGRINWEWHKERLYNWVRAQARPYPGAFCFYNAHKIVIHKIQFSNIGYRYDDKNGLILAVSKQTIIVKTPNGAVELLDYEAEKNIQFTVGGVLT